MNTYWIVLIFVGIILTDVVANWFDSKYTLSVNTRGVFDKTYEKIAFWFFWIVLGIHLMTSTGFWSGIPVLVAAGIPSTLIVAIHIFQRRTRDGR